MSETSKSPKRVLCQAYVIGKRSLPSFSHRFSPQMFTQPQLFACLILKAFFQTDYRGIEGILKDLPELGAAIGMKRVPHFTTLQKAEKRILNKEKTRKLLQETIRGSLSPRQMRRIVELAAMDGTGFESRHVSDYFMKRLNFTGKELWFQKYPKIGLLCDCSTHMTLAFTTARGPSPDAWHFDELLRQAWDNLFIRIKHLLADAGYDGEHNHESARKNYGIKTLIPATIGRPTSSLPKGKWRRFMTTRFNKKRYGQRWQIETLFSMLKRRLGSALSARSLQSQSRELGLRILALNIMILAALYCSLIQALEFPFEY